MHFHAGGTVKSEFEKRAAYISTEESHVFHPVMERCLEENPQARGTFEEVIVHLKKYSKSKLDEVNVQEIDQHYMNDLLYQCLCIITYSYIVSCREGLRDRDHSCYSFKETTTICRLIACPSTLLYTSVVSQLCCHSTYYHNMQVNACSNT